MPVEAGVTGEMLARLPAARYALMAFCGRAGHQSYRELDDTPLDDLEAYARALQDLCEREAEAMRGKD